MQTIYISANRDGTFSVMEGSYEWFSGSYERCREYLSRA